MSLPSIGLLGRIVLALSLVGLAPLGILAFQLISENRVALTDQVIQTHAVAARTAADRTEAFLSPAADRAFDLAGNEAINAAAGSSEGVSVLSASVQGLNGAMGIQVRNLQGDVAGGVVVRGAADTVNEVLRDPAPSRLGLVMVSGEAYVRICEPLRHAEGTVDVVIDAADLTAFLTSREIGEEAVLGLFDQSGALISGSTPGLSAASFPPTLLRAGRSGKAAGSGRYEADGGQILGAFAPVGSTGWFVASKQPSVIADRVATRLRRRSLTALGVSLGLMALMGSLAYTSLVRPVRALIEAQRRFLGTSSRQGTAAQGGEVGELSAAFKTIEQRIHDQEALGEVFLGRYQVVKVLGQGAMGCVFLGHDPKLQRGVALKTIRMGVSLPEAERKDLMTRLLKEAVTVAQLNHPNVVDVFDVEDTPEAAFIAMELVVGESLEERIERGPRLGIEAVVPLGAQIARALEAAHAQGIVHHDVKPANILLGDNGAVKVTDFGIAELLSTLANRPDGIWGTLGYLPPETLLNGSYNESSDVFALGAVLYECLSHGKAAISGSTPQERTKATIRPIPSIRTHCPDLPEAMESLIMEMLSPRPDQRRRSMSQIAETLESMASQNQWRWTVSPANWTPDLAPPRPSPPSPVPPAPISPGLTAEIRKGRL